MVKLELKQFEGQDPAFAQVLAQVQFAHERVAGIIKDLTPEQLAKTPEGFGNSMATLVVHTATTEISFSHLLKGQPFPEELKADFPAHIPGTPLPDAKGETAASLTAKLEKSFGYVVATLQELPAEALTREYAMGPERSATGQWLVSLLAFHIASHYGQMQIIKKHV